MEENKRGAIRKKPDPMAMKTKGRVTTYESREIAGVGTRLRRVSTKVRVRVR